MALHLTPEDHQADPPTAWTVNSAGDRWELKSSAGGTLDTFRTRAAALAAKDSGYLVTLYETEGRWFAGATIPGWKPYPEIVAEREQRAARNAELAAMNPGLTRGDVGRLARLAALMDEDDAATGCLEPGEHVDDMAARIDYERFGDDDTDPEWATPGFDPATHHADGTPR